MRSILDMGVYVFIPGSQGLGYLTEQSCEILSALQYINLFCLGENQPLFRIPSLLPRERQRAELVRGSCWNAFNPSELHARE